MDYYGLKGMSFLVIMEIRWKVDGEISEIKYSFVYYVLKGYSGQDHVQMEDIIQLTVDTVQDCHPAAKNVIIQSDIASDFTSQYFILFIFNMNTRLDDEKHYCVEQMYIHRSTNRENTIVYSLFISQ